MTVQLHPREHDRVAAVRSLRIMDTPPVPDLERIAELSAVLCGVPFGSVNILDFDRHYTVASYGTPAVHASREDSLCALAIEDDKVLYAPDAQVDPRFQEKRFLHLAKPTIHLFAAAPICTADRLPVGTVRIYGPEPAELTQRQLSGLEDLADLAMSVLQLRSAARTLHNTATTDALTGLPNRHAMELMLTAEPHGVRVLAYADFDGFKAINDRHGHSTGDEVLRAAARRIDSEVGDDDAVYRVGGDEFVIAVRSDCPAEQVAERLRSAVEREPVTVNGVDIDVSVTVGAIEVPVGVDADRVLAEADAEMYRTKAHRRVS